MRQVLSRMDEVVVIGVGMHRFGRFADKRLGDLARDAVWLAIEDAGIDPRLLDIAYVANCYHGFFTGQCDAIAPVALGYTGLSGLAMCHVSGGTGAATLAFHDAVLAVGSGLYRMALAVGVEKQYVPGDPVRSIAAINTSLEHVVATDMGMTPLAELAMGLRRLMQERGWTRKDFAHITAKNRQHAANNPLAEIQQAISVEEILAAREVAWPLTRPMCASAAVDGAAAAIVCTRHCATPDRRRAAARRGDGAWQHALRVTGRSGQTQRSALHGCRAGRVCAGLRAGRRRPAGSRTAAGPRCGGAGRNARLLRARPVCAR